jgi:DNA-binding phage protein
MLTPLATGAGLVTLATNSIQAAEGMHDLAQRTGLSVEALSRFRRPAALAGTDIESVAKSLQRLSKGLVEGKGSSVDALASLGISFVDASGKLKATDQILLEVADRFKNMEDGAEKTGLAIQLFGRSGAEMIPMLNEGSAALSQFKGITTDYARQADQAGDSMVMLQGKIGALGGQIAIILLPFLTQATEALAGFVDGFSKLPGPLQVVAGGLALLVIAWGPLIGALTSTIQLVTVLSGLKLGAIVVGWANAVVPALAAMTTAFSGFVAFLTTTILPALLAFFSGPAGWITLAVVAVIGMAIAFREPIGQFLAWLGEALPQGFNAAWEAVKTGTTGVWAWLGGKWQELAQAFNNVVVQPIISAWNAVTTAIPNAMNTAANAVASTWSNVMNGIRSIVNGVLSSIVGGINSVVGQINNLINAYNNLPGSPNIPNVPTMGVPAFALGGYVKGPTLALIGEGGEGESVVPDSKRLGFAMNVLRGMSGAAAIPAFANGGYVVGSEGMYRSGLVSERQFINNIGRSSGPKTGLMKEYERRVAQAAQDITDPLILSVKKNSIATDLGLTPAVGTTPMLGLYAPSRYDWVGRSSPTSVMAAPREVRVNVPIKAQEVAPDMFLVNGSEVRRMALEVAQQAIAANNAKQRQPSAKRLMGVR